MPNQNLNAAMKVWPPAADGVAITPGGGWANSAYAELVAATSSAAYLAGVVITYGSADTVEIDIATGAAASEVVICTFKVRVVGNADDSGYLQLPLPIDNIANGDRVSARMRGNAGGGTWRVKALYFDKPASGTFLATAQPQKVTSPSALGPGVTAGVPWASGAWTEFIASTAAAIVISGFIPSCEGSINSEVDIGVGGAGAETVVYTFPVYADVSGGISQMAFLSPFDNIGAGVRVSLRARGSSIARAYLSYYEKPL